MDLPSRKVDQWTVETAQMKHSARKYSMNAVAQKYLRVLAAECEIENYTELLQTVQATPEKYEELSEPEREFCDLSSSVGVWATVAGCIKPYIPLDEWLGFDDGKIEKLSTAVQELNPHWFVQADQEKKTDELLQTSTEGSVIL